MAQPLKRAERVLGLREGWAEVEFDASLDTCQDGSAIEHATSASTFHKTLPHNELGEVPRACLVSLRRRVHPRL